MIPLSLGRHTRRDFLRTSTLTLAGLGLVARPARAEPPPEVKTLRLSKEPYACMAPQYVIDEFLAAEGFSGVQRVDVGEGSTFKLINKGELDFMLDSAVSIVTNVDAGEPVVTLAGLHGGCYELFGTDRVRSIRDLKGKTVALLSEDAPERILVSAMAAYVGLDPRRDIKWAAHPFEETKRLLAESKVDAYMAFPPEPQELRAKRIGRVIVNTTTDRPWSEQFCCMAVGSREFVRRHPVATKRFLRAILKAADLCASRARSGRPLPRRQGLHDESRVHQPDPPECHIHEVADGQPRGDAPLLRAAAPRRRHDQGHSAKDPRPGHRLAVPERAEEGVEGIGR